MSRPFHFRGNNGKVCCETTVEDDGRIDATGLCSECRQRHQTMGGVFSLLRVTTKKNIPLNPPVIDPPEKKGEPMGKTLKTTPATGTTAFYRIHKFNDPEICACTTSPTLESMFTYDNLKELQQINPVLLAELAAFADEEIKGKNPAPIPYTFAMARRALADNYETPPAAPAAVNKVKPVEWADGSYPKPYDLALQGKG